MRFSRGRPWFTVAVSFVAASALVLASSVARAESGDADGDHVPDDIEDLTERNVVWTADPMVAPKTLSLSSSSIGAPTDDRFRFTYREGQFDVAYYRDDVGGLASSFSLEFVDLFEWVDENGDHAIEQDERVGVWSLGGSAFESALVSYHETPSVDGGVVYTFEVRSTWPAGTQVTLLLTAAHRFLRLSPDRILTPMEVKMDMYLNHTFQTLGSRVGIELRVETSDVGTMTYERDSWDSKRGFSRDESWINVTEGDTFSTTFFSWANNATSDGTSAPVTVLTNGPTGALERSYEVLLAYPAGPRPDVVHVVHDPTFGVVSAAYDGILRLPPPASLHGDLILYGVSLVGMVALVAATVFLAGRRRRKRE